MYEGDAKTDEQHSPRITILYGSQTGTAQDIAERIWRQAKKYQFQATVLPMNEYPVTNIQYDELMVFVCSTTGQGEEPDNMKMFWKILLRKSLPPNSLSHIKYAVLGLGDSSYVKFNFVAKRLFKRLQQLGGYPLVPVHLADDQHDLGIDFTVDPFTKLLWEQIDVANKMPIPSKIINEDEIIFRWKVEEAQNVNRPLKLKNIYDLQDGKSIEVVVKSNERITHPKHFQEVRLIKLKHTDMTSFIPGDIVMIRPKNSNHQIKEFFHVLSTNKVKFHKGMRINLLPNFPDMPVPQVLKNSFTLEQICKDYWDLSAIPRRYTFEILGKITPNELEKEKCVEFQTPAGQQELYNYCNRPRRNIVEVLNDFPHATSKLTLEILFEIMPPIRERAFSIASSCVAYPYDIQILVAVVRYKTKLVKERLGLCSHWLSTLPIGTELYVEIKKGSMRFPEYIKEWEKLPPMIMVGPGTGVAPFRSYIMERIALGTASNENLMLFFGCRNEKMDFICKEEFLKLTESQKLTLICAFSRDQDEKVYVQHKILEKKDLIADLILNKNAHIYVAGNSKNMPTDVRNAFIETLMEYRGLPKENIEDYIEQLEKEGRYQTETWA